MKRCVDLGFAVAALVSLATAAQAQTQGQSRYGAGDVLCSQYLKAARTSDILYHQASNWLLGFVSGMNAALRATKDEAAVVTIGNDEVLKAAWDYCASNPSSRIASVAETWYAMLPKQMEAAKPAEEKKSGGWTIDLNRSRIAGHCSTGAERQNRTLSPIRMPWLAAKCAGSSST